MWWVVGANPGLTVKAVMLRKFGQEIIRPWAGGAFIPFLRCRAASTRPSKREERDSILQGLDQAIEAIQIGLQIMKDWAAKNMEDINKFAVFPTGYFGLITPENGLELYDGNIRLIDRNGSELERFDGANYLDYIQEHVEPWSYLKFPFYKKMGYPDGVYRVGPLGRLNIADKIDTPLANDELKIFKSLNGGKANRLKIPCTTTMPA
jgi:NAD-reducing hydrogenase large subunit